MCVGLSCCARPSFAVELQRQLRVTFVIHNFGHEPTAHSHLISLFQHFTIFVFLTFVISQTIHDSEMICQMCEFSSRLSHVFHDYLRFCVSPIPDRRYAVYSTFLCENSRSNMAPQISLTTFHVHGPQSLVVRSVSL